MSPAGRGILRDFGALALETASRTATPPDETGWIRCEIPIESIELAVREILRFGTEAEVLEPPALRQAVNKTLAQIAGFYT